MLIVNADDYGLTRSITDNIAHCYRHRRISSTTAMVFMIETDRAADLAKDLNMPVGLHLNLDYAFKRTDLSPKLLEHQQRLINFFNSSPWARHIYNPLIRDSLRYSFNAQLDEFKRLFKKDPIQVDGHQYIHHSTSLILSNILPKGIKLRPKRSDWTHEKVGKKIYRGLFNYFLKRRFKCVDKVYDADARIPDILNLIQHAVIQSQRANIELMVHIGDDPDLEMLMSDEYQRVIAQTRLGSYSDL